MRSFVWILPLDRVNALGRGGVSANYVIPKNHLSDPPKNLCGAHIWIIVRGSLDRCVAVVTPKRVERFLEGYYSGDFLVTSDLSKSLRLAQDYDSARGNEVDFPQQFGIGIHEVSNSSSEKLISLIERCIQTKLLVPSIGDLSNMTFPSTSKRPEAFISAALSNITLKFSLDQMWGSGIGQRLNPVSNFAQQVLRLSGRQFQVDLFALYDPVNYFLRKTTSNFGGSASESVGASKVVDLDFTSINPDRVYAREFVIANLLPIDLENALDKTERAEKLHQDMLRDISTYLLNIGAIPYESSSIDLMTEYQGRTKIYEIKSSNDSNVISQSAKGAFQIACYLNAMAPDYDCLDSALILHRIENIGLQAFAVNSLHRLGIHCLIYDPLLNWPDRVRGLLTP